MFCFISLTLARKAEMMDFVLIEFRMLLQENLIKFTKQICQIGIVWFSLDQTV